MDDGGRLELHGASIVRRQWWPITLAAMVFFAATSFAIFSQSVPGAVVAALSLVAWLRASSLRPPLAGAPNLKLEVDEIGVSSNGMPIVAREEIASGALWPQTTHGTLVSLDRRGFLRPPVEVRVQSLDDGRALLRTLALDASHARAHVHVKSLVRAKGWLFWPIVLSPAFLLVSMLFVIATMHGSQGWMGWLALLLVLSFTVSLPFIPVALLWPTSVTIGSDALLVRFALYRKMIRFADLVRYESTDRGVRFVMRSGGTYELVTDRGGFGWVKNDQGWEERPATAPKRDLILERLSEAMAVRAGTIEPTLLDRGERTLSEWIRDLRALTRKIEAFRQVAIPHEQLWRALEDGKAEPSVRAAAAVALSPSLDESGRARLRIAAKAVVSPKLRLAIELSANDEQDDERLADALEEVMPEKKRGA